MDFQSYPRYDLHQIEQQARALRAEASRNALKAFVAWLRKPRGLDGGNQTA